MLATMRRRVVLGKPVGRRACDATLCLESGPPPSQSRSIEVRRPAISCSAAAGEGRMDRVYSGHGLVRPMVRTRSAHMQTITFSGGRCRGGGAAEQAGWLCAGPRHKFRRYSPHSRPYLWTPKSTSLMLMTLRGGIAGVDMGKSPAYTRFPSWNAPAVGRRCKLSAPNPRPTISTALPIDVIGAVLKQCAYSRSR